MNQHQIGLCLGKGKGATSMVTMNLAEVLSNWQTDDYLVAEKERSRLMTMGYRCTKSLYQRLEESFEKYGVMFVDCDNTKTNGASDILDRFNAMLDGYEHWTYETASSTKECPRFRGMIPLDAELEWKGAISKKAIGVLFSDFVDDGASWFYEPTLGKLDTLKHYDGIQYPSTRVSEIVSSLEANEKVESYLREKKTELLYGDRRRGNAKCDPYKLPCVKKYLEGSWGEGTDRRPRAHAAIFGMIKCDVPSDEIYDVIMAGPASEFRRFLRDSFRDSCHYHRKNLVNPF